MENKTINVLVLDDSAGRFMHLNPIDGVEFKLNLEFTDAGVSYAYGEGVGTSITDATLQLKDDDFILLGNNRGVGLQRAVNICLTRRIRTIVVSQRDLTNAQKQEYRDLEVKLFYRRDQLNEAVSDLLHGNINVT